MAKVSNFLIGLSLIILLILSSIGYPYILPPTQIIEFMTNKFTKIERLKIIQLNKIKDLNQEGEGVFGEIIYFWFPTLYRSEIAGQLGKRLIIHDGIKTLRVIDREITSEGESWDIPYRFLMLAQNPERLLERLKDLGMNLDKASLTRFEGRIAYLIGEKEEGSPKLLVDKDLFVPLLLQYGNILLRFSDYREFMEQNWYPYKIAYSFNGDIIEEYTIKDIIVNPSLDLSLFDIPLISSQFGKSE
jgi:hypothetical protein